MKRAPIVLTTDFGHEDEYVGVLKGVMLSINPDAVIVDLTNAIPPQDIRRAAVLLKLNHRYFPPGSIHLCIVDPGVGSGRKILLIKASGQFFIGPDNGVFSLILAADQSAEVYELTNRDWFLEEISTTFQGRDLMAPAAARISKGEPIKAAGPAIAPESCSRLDTFSPLLRDGEIVGEVFAIDRFGNIITNVDKDHLDKIFKEDEIIVWIKGHPVVLYRLSYEDMPDQQPAAIINSSNMVEICVKNGSAADKLVVESGEPVRLTTR